MAEKRFSELTATATLTDADIFALSQVDSGSNTLMSKRTTLIAIANKLASGTNYTSALNTQDKTLTGAINELKQLVSLIPQFSIEVVQSLPVSDISETTIYLVPAEDPEVGNYYEEYIYVNQAWELVGTTAVDLSAYYTKLEVDGLLADKANTADVTASLLLKEDKSALGTDVRSIIADLKAVKTATITDGVASFDGVIEASPLKALSVEITPTQSGSGTPSPDNVRPISGWTEEVIENFPDSSYESFFEGVRNGTHGFVDLGSLSWTYSSSGYFQTLKNSIGAKLEMGINLLCTIYQRVEKGGIDYTIYDADTSIRIRDSRYSDETTFKTAMSGVYLIYELATPTTPTYTDAEYETLVKAFGGSTTTIPFGQTIYGGELNVLTGELTKKWGLVDIGTLGWSRVADGYFRVNLPGRRFGTNADGIFGICDSYDFYGNSTSNAIQNNIANGQFAYQTTNVIIWIRNDSYTTAEDFQTAMSGKYLCYELATPETITITPTQIELLKGVNNVSASTGDVIECKFTEMSIWGD